jgi:hypothetical protein
MNKALLTALQNATKGLLYPSETDKPFEPFSWGKADGDLTPQKVAALVKAPAGTAVAQQSLADFFQYLTANGTDHAAEFRQLQQVIGKQLAGAQVFRVGSVTLDVYIVGRTSDGEWAGLKTQSVET